MLTRRELLTRGVSAGAVAALLPSCLRARRDDGAAVPQALVETGEWVNDVHSQLNRTHVLGVEQPTSLEALQVLVRRAAHERRAVSICGGRHAMGGQQFGTDTLLIDLSSFHGVTDFDAERGQVEAGAGTRWPELIADLIERQRDRAGAWGIVQKQTGADGLSLGGSLSANVHGRGLVHRPLVQDVEAFTLVDARGEALRCSRSENSELFTLAIGGYGLFGVITSVRLRLSPRRKLRRVVEIADVKGLADRFADRIAHGFLYGDFQYSTDVGSEGLLRTGVFSCYEPVPDDTPIPEGQRSLSRSDWLDLLELSHENRAEAFRRYAAHYVSTSGQIGWTDSNQLASYIADYHRELGARIAGLEGGTEMITELYVPRAELAGFLEAVRADIEAYDMNLIYGTVRLIERDDETVLAWARESWACVIFNLHTAHDAAALVVAAEHFRRLIERARERGGSYYLTYHRWATREQVLACHPRLPEFLTLKLQYDPEERFQSDWYRHHRALLAG